MKRRISLVLAFVMLFAMAAPSLAEEASPILENASGFYYIEAEGERPRLSAASQDKFMQVDGEWFKDFKAYKEDNVWRTSNDFYQKMDKMGEMVADIYEMLYGENVSDELTYVSRLTGDEKAGCRAIASVSVGGIAVIAMGVAAIALVKRKKKA